MAYMTWATQLQGRMGPTTCSTACDRGEERPVDGFRVPYQDPTPEAGPASLRNYHVAAEPPALCFPTSWWTKLVSVSLSAQNGYHACYQLAA